MTEDRGFQMTAPFATVLHMRTSRPTAPRFQAELDDLNAGVASQLEAMGWNFELVACSETLLTVVRRKVATADVVIIVGGEDVDPRFYQGAGGYQDEGEHDYLSDVAQLQVVEDCVALGKPLLGLCRGLQVMNVALGGTLIPHLETTAMHRGGAGGLGPYVRHPVRLTAEGRAYLDDSGAIADGEVVYSTHHQAVNELGEGLIVVAKSPDGVIEAVVHESLPFLGVQWHPEHPDAFGEPISRLLSYITKAKPV